MRRLLPLLLVPLLLARAGSAAELRLAPGEPLDDSHLQQLVADRLPPVAPDERLAIEWYAPSLPLSNAATVPTVLRLADFQLDPDSGRLDGRIEARLVTGEATTLVLAGRLRRSLAVAVPAFALPRGTIVEADMLRTVWLPTDRLGTDTLRKPAELVGFETRRRLPPDRPVGRDDLLEPRLVRRGESVTMIYRSPGLELVAVGRALEDGTAGSIVRLVNVDSRRPVRARVIGLRTVAIEEGSAP